MESVSRVSARDLSPPLLASKPNGHKNGNGNGNGRKRRVRREGWCSCIFGQFIPSRKNRMESNNNNNASCLEASKKKETNAIPEILRTNTPSTEGSTDMDSTPSSGMHLTSSIVSTTSSKNGFYEKFSDPVEVNTQIQVIPIDKASNSTAIELRPNNIAALIESPSSTNFILGSPLDSNSDTFRDAVSEINISSSVSSNSDEDEFHEADSEIYHAHVNLIGSIYTVSLPPGEQQIAVCYLFMEVLHAFEEKQFQSTDSNLVKIHELLPHCKGISIPKSKKHFSMEEFIPVAAIIDQTISVVVDGSFKGRASSVSPSRGTSFLGSPSYSPMIQANFPDALLPMSVLPRYPGTNNDRKNCWDEIDATIFQVRGKTYMKDSVKKPSTNSAYGLVGVDLFRQKYGAVNVSSRPDSFVNRYLQNVNPKSFIFCINFVLPWGNLVAYFAPNYGKGSTNSGPYVGDKTFDDLMKSYLESDDKFRNKRLKIIPQFVDGPWVVKTVMGSRPAILGTKIECTYHKSANHLEVDINIGSSTAAHYILGVCESYTTLLTVDLCFVLQGESEEELPERVLCGFRICQVDLESATDINTIML